MGIQFAIQFLAKFGRPMSSVFESRKMKGSAKHYICQE